MAGHRAAASIFYSVPPEACNVLVAHQEAHFVSLTPNGREWLSERGASDPLLLPFLANDDELRLPLYSYLVEPPPKLLAASFESVAS